MLYIWIASPYAWVLLIFGALCGQVHTYLVLIFNRTVRISTSICPCFIFGTGCQLLVTVIRMSWTFIALYFTLDVNSFNQGIYGIKYTFDGMAIRWLLHANHRGNIIFPLGTWWGLDGKTNRISQIEHKKFKVILDKEGKTFRDK